MCSLLWVEKIGKILMDYHQAILLYDSFAFALIYIFCKKFPTKIFGVLFVLRMKSAHFPWFYIVFNILMGHSYKNLLIGLIVGHMYIYLKEILPISHKVRILATPRFVFFD